MPEQTRRTHFDVAVVGGGPAGTSAALALAQAGASVVVVERTRYEQARVGETLPGACRALLARLGVWERFLALCPRRAPCVLSAWGGEDLSWQDALYDPHGEGWHVDRRAFDAMLAEQAQASGVDVRRGTSVARVHAVDGEFQLVFSHARGSETLSARGLVDATGRAASVATQLGATRRVHDALIGLVAFVPAPPAFFGAPNHGTPATEATLVEAAADGWWYSAPLPDASFVVAFMTDADLLPRGRAELRSAWRAALARTQHTLARLGTVPECDLRVAPARSSVLEPAGGPGWLAIGDAALAMDPLSSGGVLEALRSGLGVATVLTASASLDGAQHAAATSQRAARYLIRRAHYYGAERRWGSSPFWRRRGGVLPEVALSQAKERSGRSTPNTAPPEEITIPSLAGL